jgi:Kef-type K+ transport system membrane component KefB
MDRWIVSVGMIPRGEVGLIFATIGLQNHLVNAPEYAAILNMVVFTTVLTPLFLGPLIRRSGSRQPSPLPPAADLVSMDLSDPADAESSDP